MKIGIGITTRNRLTTFRKCLRNIKNFAPENAVIVIVDDGSDKPIRNATYRFGANAGIAPAKNKCIELLMDAGCTHLFLFDDDTWPITENWWVPYVGSGIKHLSFTFSGVVDGRRNGRTFLKNIGNLAEYDSPCGCMLYFTREVIEQVGGFDVNYPLWGFEHVDFSNRVFNAGLTPQRYLDVRKSLELFYSSDYHCIRSSSVPGVIRRQVIPENKNRFKLQKDSKTYMDYKSADKGIILAAYFNANPDPQRGVKWESGGEALDPLIESCSALDLPLMIFHDCLKGDQWTKIGTQHEYSPNVYRWMVYRDWLKKNPQEQVFMVDSTDVEVLRNPFLSINPDTLYSGCEYNMPVDNAWMRQRQEYLLRDIADYRITIAANAKQILPNCGIVGGSYKTVMEYLDLRYLYHKQYTKGQLQSTDMAVHNYIVWKHFKKRLVTGLKVSTRFKKFERNEVSWFKHK